jgi:uncharacterized protein
MDRRAFLAFSAASLVVPLAANSQSTSDTQGRAPLTWQQRLLVSARRQIGVTTIYDPAYVRITYPGGDVPAERGVCTDVVIRAYREAFGVDLQKLVHEDMRTNFGLYPRRWGLSRPDTHIDHRRVPNLQVFFTRKGQAFPDRKAPGDFEPGDIVTQMLPGNLPHIGVVSSSRKRNDAPYDVIHNIGRGTQEEDILLRFPVTGRYRYAAAAQPA